MRPTRTRFHRIRGLQQMSEVYILSDAHIGHKNILKYRPEFSSIEDHDRTILENIFITCGKRDTLWLLGDCFFNNDAVDNFLLPTLDRGITVNFIPGNHDTDSAERQKVLKRVIGLVNEVHTLRKYKKGFWLSHHPIHPEQLFGRVNIHGHVHTETIKDDRYFNACCENIGYRPINIGKIWTKPE
jgi:calcineurin-like phosphoesterase family protein